MLLCPIVLCAHASASLRTHSCVAAISTVAISGDWQGTVLFYDFETRSELGRIENAHAGGVTAVTTIASSNEEDLFAGLVELNHSNRTH